MKNKHSCRNLDDWNRQLERVLLQMYSSGLIENEEEESSFRRTKCLDIDFFDYLLKKTLKEIIELKNAKKYRKRSEKHFIIREEEKLFGWKSVPIQSCKHYLKTEEVECDCKISFVNGHQKLSFFKNGKFSMLKIKHITRYPGQDFVCDRTQDGMNFHLDPLNGYVSPLEEDILTRVTLTLDPYRLYENETPYFLKSLYMVVKEPFIVPIWVYNFVTLKSSLFKISFFFMSEKWIDPFSFQYGDYFSKEWREISLNENSSRIFLEEQIFKRERFNAIKFTFDIFKAFEEDEKQKLSNV